MINCSGCGGNWNWCLDKCDDCSATKENLTKDDLAKDKFKKEKEE